jgi:hypothetical protein
MSESLRDKIAQALVDEMNSVEDMEPDSEEFVIDCGKLADAVMKVIAAHDE